MKHIVAELVSNALANLPELAEAAADLSIETTVERTRDASHGDFASNIAMRLAKPARKSPRDIAARVVESLGDRIKVASDILTYGYFFKDEIELTLCNRSSQTFHSLEYV